MIEKLLFGTCFCLSENLFLSHFNKFLCNKCSNFSYIVERRDTSSGKWEECAKTRYGYITIEGLKPNHSYEFRISAENKHGVSEPCEATAPVLIPEQRHRKKGCDG